MPIYKPLLYSLLQSSLLVAGQIFLKLALARMLPFGWNREFWLSLLANWRFALCGAFFTAAGLLWMQMVKRFALSTIYPMVSLSYVIALVACIFVFHEEVGVSKWIGAFLIILGCLFMAR